MKRDRILSFPFGVMSSFNSITNQSPTLFVVQSSSIIPNAPSAYDLGSQNYPYNNIWANTVHGVTGVVGPTGPAGPTGPPGATGPAGTFPTSSQIITTNSTTANSSYNGAISAPNGGLGVGLNAYFGSDLNILNNGNLNMQNGGTLTTGAIQTTSIAGIQSLGGPIKALASSNQLAIGPNAGNQFTFTTSGPASAVQVTIPDPGSNTTLNFADGNNTWSGTQTFTNNISARNVMGGDVPQLQTGTSYTLALSDANTIIRFNNGSNIAVTIPLNASVAFTTGTKISFVQSGAGKVTLSGAGGVTLNGSSGFLSTASQYSIMTAWMYAVDVWLVYGDRGV